MSVLKHVFRRFAGSPMFTSVSLLTLALGIGATTAIFSVIDGVLIKPLPLPHADSLVGLWHTAPGVTGINGKLNMSPAMYFTYREQNHSFEQLGLWQGFGASVTGNGDPEELRVLNVTYGTLDALGIQPLLGRWFSQSDDTPGTAQTAILTYGYWQRRFAGDKQILGRTLTVNAVPHTIIGVMPASFTFENIDAQMILPLRFDRSKINLGNFSYSGVARLKPGVTLQQADADVARLIPIWLKSWPPPPGFSVTLFESAHFGPALQPLKEEVVGDIGATLWIIMGTLALVLLIACANVANLLLVRAEGRRQELAIRAALGAGWGRIAGEMLVESITLGLLGGALGLAFAYAAVRILVAKGPSALPRLQELGIDPTVLAFAVAVSLLSGALFGVIPILKYAAPHIALTLRSAGRSVSDSRERHRARNTLVVVQVGLALVLLIGSGLMIRTSQALHNVQPGFTHPEQLQLLRIAIPEDAVKDETTVTRMENQMLDKLAAIPGVTSAAIASGAPLEGFNSNDVLEAEDKNYDAEGKVPPVRRYRYISPNFFKTTGTALIAGRDFEWSDVYNHGRVAIVSENLAREWWGNPRNALGKHIREGAKDPWREIVGVAADVYDNGMQEKPPAFAYWPIMMDAFYGPVYITRGPVFILRTARAGTEGILSDGRQAIWSVDKNLPVFLTRTVNDLYSQSMARTSFTLVLLIIAGIMSLILGVVGIYGVIAYAVSQRTREIGIRMALGAAPSGLQRMFLRSGLLLASIGAVLGLAAAAGFTQLMKSLLFGVTALDPVTYAGFAFVLIAAAAIASYIPARRATRIDPLEALRSE